MTARISYTECPHCHHEVMERADGVCLACGKNRLDLCGTRPELTVLQIDNIHHLPACCLLCGSDTGRMQRFRWNYKIDPWHFPVWMIPFLRLFSYLPGSEFSTTERLTLPCCPACSGVARRIRPLSVRTGLDCRLLVHRRFRQRFEELNGRGTLEWQADMRTPQVAAAVPAELPVSIRI